MKRNPRAGIWLMILAVTLFAIQDGFSRHLAETYNVFMIVMIRYWLFGAFVLIWALRRPGGLRSVATPQPLLHLARASLLIAEVCVIIWGYTIIGLIESHAVFAVCPLLIAAMSGPLLGERLGLRGWAAILAGMVGVLVILQPGSGIFTPAALLPFAAASMFALYSVLTRKASARDSSFNSLFWSGTIGAVIITAIGLPQWEPMTGLDWGMTAIYATVALIANYVLIKCYEVAEASSVQPFAYLQIVLVSIIGVVVYDEALDSHVMIGAAIVIAAGLVTLLTTRARAAEAG
ncbi:MAG: DMT family transporter [Rhodobacteraceae bacterium]|nr:DMT family transporter [Paracoccaceae bacterium]